MPMPFTRELPFEHSPERKKEREALRLGVLTRRLQTFLDNQFGKKPFSLLQTIHESAPLE